MCKHYLLFRDDRSASSMIDVLSHTHSLAGFSCRTEDTTNDHYRFWDSDDLNLLSVGITCFALSPEGSSSVQWILQKHGRGPGNEPGCQQEIVLASGSGHALPTNVANVLSIFYRGRKLNNVLNLRVKRHCFSLTCGPAQPAHLAVAYVTATLPEKDEPRRVGRLVELSSEEHPFRNAEAIIEALRSRFNLLLIHGSALTHYFDLVHLARIRNSRRKVILDMDTGVDDALALIMGLRSPELDILGVTTTGGNIGAGRAQRNTQGILRFVAHTDPDVSRRYPELPPTAKGRTASKSPGDATDVHGPDGIGGASENASYRPFFGHNGKSPEHADQLFADLMRNHPPGAVSLVTTGPLTNLAHWIETMPQLVERLQEIICMGGAFFECGNRSPVAEFNVFTDPGAAKKVVEFCRQPVADQLRTWRERVRFTFVGLDVTHRVRLHRRVLADLIARHPTNDILPFVRELTGYYMDFYYRNEGLDGCYLHDPLAVAYAVDPTFCHVDRYHVEIEDQGRYTSGMSIADYRPTRIFKEAMKEVTYVCRTVDAYRFEKHFLETLTK